MAMYNTTVRTPPGRTPTNGATLPDTHTYQGAPGYTRDPATELYLLAVAHMGVGAFYEHEQGRTHRYRQLVTTVASKDPDWLRGFLPWLRHTAGMRTAAVTGAVDAAVAMVRAGVPGGRSLIAQTLARADEPGEALAYYRYTYGRTLPPAVRDGIRDAVQRLYTQFNTLKWDSHETKVQYQFADVLRLVHPKPQTPEQAALFRYLTRQRRDRTAAVPLALDMVRHHKAMRHHLLKGGKAALDGYTPEQLTAACKQAGMTWEDLVSIAGETDIDPRTAWETAMPYAGLHAVVKNLRNLDRVGFSEPLAQRLQDRLADPEQVRQAKLMPLMLYGAYRQLRSLRWGHALEQAVNHALAHVPAFTGRTLVLVDRSGSMFWSTLDDLRRHLRDPMGHRMRNHYSHSPNPEETTLADAAALFGSAVALRAEHADLYQFDNTVAQVRFDKGDALLRVAEVFTGGGGTNITGALAATYNGHDRVVIITDEQTARTPGWSYQMQHRPSYDVLGRVVNRPLLPEQVPVYTWNLGGYPAGYLPHAGNQFVFGGLSDASWAMVAQLERTGATRWPW